MISKKMGVFPKTKSIKHALFEHCFAQQIVNERYGLEQEN